MTIQNIFVKHGIFYLSTLGIILFLYWFIYRGVTPGDSTPYELSKIIQDTISTGLTAVSIALPLTVGILGYAMKEKIDCLDFLFSASLFFLISICAALWNLFRLPGLVKTVNMVSDYKTAVFQIIQLYSLLYGFLYLIIGAWKIFKN